MLQHCDGFVCAFAEEGVASVVVDLIDPPLLLFAATSTLWPLEFDEEDDPTLDKRPVRPAGVSNVLELRGEPTMITRPFTSENLMVYL